MANAPQHHKIKNPLTGRSIKRNGVLHKKLIREGHMQEVSSSAYVQVVPKPKVSKKNHSTGNYSAKVTKRVISENMKIIQKTMNCNPERLEELISNLVYQDMNKNPKPEKSIFGTGDEKFEGTSSEEDNDVLDLSIPKLVRSPPRKENVETEPEPEPEPEYTKDELEEDYDQYFADASSTDYSDSD